MDKIKTLLKSIHIFKKYIFIYFCHTTQCVGSYFSNQRLNFCPSALEVWSLHHRTIREASKIKTLDGPKSLFLLGGRSWLWLWGERREVSEAGRSVDHWLKHLHPCKVLGGRSGKETPHSASLWDLTNKGRQISLMGLLDYKCVPKPSSSSGPP